MERFAKQHGYVGIAALKQTRYPSSRRKTSENSQDYSASRTHDVPSRRIMRPEGAVGETNALWDCPRLNIAATKQQFPF